MQTDRVRRRLICSLLLICVAGYTTAYRTATTAGQPIRSDGFSYYVYLPSWFIYGDASLDSVARDCCGGAFPEFTAIIRWPGTGQWVNAHPIGVAVMQAPFFLIAHALTHWTNLSPDGFSLYYQHAVGLAGLFWVVAGLWVLHAVLSRHFTAGVAAATVVAILFGTNLFDFSTFDSSYSHPYSFFLIASLLSLTERWYDRGDAATSVLLGFVSGLIVLVRHTNVLFLLIVPLYAMGAAGLRPAVRLFRRRAQHVALAVLSAAMVVAPQLALYRQATGRWIVSSYGSLGFTFTSPHLFGVLFGVSKGLFFWSPLLLLACIGFAMLRGAARRFLLPCVVVLGANTYLIASWWDWQFGASFGHRGFTDSLALFALGLASLFAWATHGPLRLRVTAAFVVLLMALSTFQMLQVPVRCASDERHNVAAVSRALPSRAMTRRRAVQLLGLVACVAVVLAALRDPAWLLSTEHGFRPWERDVVSGVRYRWIGGHASFFVPAAAASFALPLRTTFGSGDAPVTISLSVDGRLADRVILTDEAWRPVSIRVTGTTSRRSRRIDLQADRTRGGNRSVQVGELELNAR